jgi:hypothetical protein
MKQTGLLDRLRVFERSHSGPFPELKQHRAGADFCEVDSLVAQAIRRL